MRKIILYAATSLDMQIAGPEGEIDWLFTDQDYGYSSFVSRIDTTLMGRKTYDTVLSFEGDFPYAGLRNVVITHNRELAPMPGVEFLHENIAAFCQALKAEKGQDIWLIGGGQLNSILLEAGLIDEMHLYIHPVWLGQGIPLFAAPTPEQYWRLHSHKSFGTGLLELIYVAQ